MPDKKARSSVCRVNKNTNFTKMGNYHLRSKALSLKAIGLLSKVLNLPDNWDYSVRGFAKICKENMSAIETALEELKENGYLEVTKLYPNQTSNKKIGYSYNFFEYSAKDKTVHIKPTDVITISNACGSNCSKVCRVTKNENYTVMNNLFLRSHNLSLNAIGLLCKVLSLPKDWDYSISGLNYICKDGKTVIKTALKELEEWGYLIRTRLNPNETESGRFEYIYDFYEISEKDIASNEFSTNSTISINKNCKKTHILLAKARQEVSYQAIEIQEEVKQEVENLSIENPPQYNTNQQINSNQISSNKSSTNQLQSTNDSDVESVENMNNGLIDEYIRNQKSYTEIIKSKIEYDHFVIMSANHPEICDLEEIDELIQIIVRTICSTTKSHKICGHEVPHETLKSVLLKVDCDCVENTLQKMKTAEKITNYERYFISTLYNETVNKKLARNTEKRQSDYQYNPYNDDI